MSLTPGTKLGPYEVVEPIGRGGMGEVYRARDTRLGRDVAIKVSNENFTERFEREARSIAALNHPNICHLYDVGPNYLVMELIEGETLKGPLPEDQALKIAQQIADALEAAHERGIIHRDLKPANIKITPDGVVKVLDFGLAKSAESPQPDPATSPTMTMSPTRAGMILGTAAYMAPEQARGKSVDRRVDVWAFGCVLYEMLTGKQAFEGETVSDIIASVLAKDPDLNAAPARLRRLLKKCLEKDPKQRLQAIGDWKLLPDELVATEHQRARLLPWAIAAVLAVLLIASGVLLWRATLPSEKPLMRFNVDLGPDAIAAPRVTATISPDGSRLVYTARGPNGKSQLAIRALDQREATLLAGTEDAVDPFFSPDSQWIGFFSGGQMKKTSVQGGGAVTVCETGAPGAARGASWGEDHQIVFTASGGPVGLSRVPDSGGARQTLTTPASGEISHRWPQVLPGGQAVLFTSTATSADYEEGFIEALSLKTGKWKVVQRGGYFGRYLPSGHLVYVHQGTLFGVPFDLDRLEVRGTPAPLLEDVDASAFYASGQFESSRNGTFVCARGRNSTSGWPIVWLDSSGKTQPLLPAAPYAWPALSPDGKRLATRLQNDIQVYDIEHDRTTRLTFNRTSTNAIWTPDGQHIVYSSSTPSGQALQWIRADGAGQAQTLMETKDLDDRSLINWSN